jgi:hypothetical protein
LTIDARARTDSGARNGLHYLLRGLALVLVLLTASCGEETFVVGTPIITFTAKPGRFTSYIVTIDEIEMTRRDGTTIELPTIDERIDLAHISSYVNLLEVPALGVGDYVSATFVLDYTDPSISVGSNGQAFPVATLLDSGTGLVATTATVTVYFDPLHPLAIQSQQSAELAIDIDLEGSNSIVQNSAGFQVTVQPFWHATTTPIYDKPVFARGLYVLANKSQSNFVMNVRPLHDVLDNPFGALTVNVNENTYYNVNGVAYVGSAGLNALNALQDTYADLQVGVYSAAGSDPFGNFNNITPSFNATQVYVGSSLESTIEDAITGIVTGIDLPNITVMDAALVTRLGLYYYQQAATVTVGSATIWSQDGVNSAPTQASLGIGQVITVQGQASLDSSGNLTNPYSLDATSTSVPSAQVRLQNTTFYGTVNSAAANPLSVNVLAWDYFQPDYIYYSGNGNGPATAADTAIATNYLINTSAATATTTPAAGSVVRVDGFASPLGQTPYFNATAVTQPTEQTLILEWSDAGSLNPFTVVNGAGIIINMQDPLLVANGVHFVETAPTILFNSGPNVIDLFIPGTAQPVNPLLTIRYASNDPSQVLYGVGNTQVGEWLFTDPTGYADRVQDTVNGAVPVTKLVATGTYDATTSTFTADHITINAVEPEST